MEGREVLWLGLACAVGGRRGHHHGWSLTVAALRLRRRRRHHRRPIGVHGHRRRLDGRGAALLRPRGLRWRLLVHILLGRGVGCSGNDSAGAAEQTAEAKDAFSRAGNKSRALSTNRTGRPARTGAASANAGAAG